MTYLPTSYTKWMALVWCELGALLGWLTHPVVWLAFGPFRWVAFIGATASQESGYNTEALGDDGESVGILQFHYSTWQDLGLSSWSRLSPFASGYAGAVYVQGAILSDLRWLGLALPGAKWGRVLWRWGTDGLENLDGALEIIATESRYMMTYVRMRAVSVAVLVGLVLLVRWGVQRRKSGGNRRGRK